jgi:hypothetical protein
MKRRTTLDGSLSRACAEQERYSTHTMSREVSHKHPHVYSHVGLSRYQYTKTPDFQKGKQSRLNAMVL